MGVALPSPTGPRVLTLPTRTIVLEDPLSRQLLREIRRIAPSDATVLVLGETGTGKEIVARYLHELSARADRPFVAVNCGGFSETLVDSELFGHERGAFTGAVSSKAGWFESADGGTLFLDEIGDLPLAVQVKLLRVLQEREVVRLGSRQPRRVDVRLVAATHVKLDEAVQAGRFREDLFFRLNVMPLWVPPLRDRPGDILPLTEHFVRTFAERGQRGSISLTSEAVQHLLEYSWPGNVRELENVVHRAVVTCQNGTIAAEDLPSLASKTRSHPPPPPRPPTTEALALEAALLDLFERGAHNTYDFVEATVVTAAFRYCHGNQLQTARLLGISRNVVRARLAKLGLIGTRPNPPCKNGEAEPAAALALDSHDTCGS